MTRRKPPELHKKVIKYDRTKVVDADAMLKPPKQVELEKEYNRLLTTRQKKFAELYVENTMSAAACAREAGFSPNAARIKASILLDGHSFPHVVEYIAHLRAEKQKLYGVTLIGQLERLHKLSRGAEEAKQFSAAINAEKIRSALGGLTVDRRENVNTIDQMTRDQITSRLLELQQKYPEAFNLTDYKDVTDVQRPGSKALAAPARSLPPDMADDED